MRDSGVSHVVGKLNKLSEHAAHTRSRAEEAIIEAEGNSANGKPASITTANSAVSRVFI